MNSYQLCLMAEGTGKVKPSFNAFLNFFLQCLTIFIIEIFYFLGKIYSHTFYLFFVSIVNDIVFIVSLLTCLPLVYGKDTHFMS